MHEQNVIMFPSIKLPFILIGMVIFTIEVSGCANKTSKDDTGKNTMPSKAFIEVLKEHTNELMSIPGVVGVAQGLCGKKPCIKVFVVEMTPEMDKKIPKNLNGYAVSVEETGEFKALQQNKK